MNGAPNSKQKGFVLSEILVAMIVLAIAAISFLHLVQNSANSMNNARTLYTQTALAHSVLQTALNSSEYDEKVFEGKDENTGLNYSVEVTPDVTRKSSSPEQPSIGIVIVRVEKPGKRPVELTSAKWMRQGTAQ